MRLGLLFLLCGLIGCTGFQLRVDVLRDGKRATLSALDGLSGGDRFSFRLKVPADSYVYLARSQDHGEPQGLYPVHQPVKLSAGVTYRLPLDGSDLAVPQLSARDRLCLVLSREPIVGSLPHCPSSDEAGFFRSGRSLRDLSEQFGASQGCAADQQTSHHGKGQRPGETGPLVCTLPVSPCQVPSAAVRTSPGPRKRALLIGISRYLPGPVGAKRRAQDLAGPGNDVASMRAVLKQRYGYRDEDICELTDHQATRTGIFAALHAFLIAPTRVGDQLVFFYAGHGSTAPNPLSTEENKLDETIVPSDANLGVPDIHDKELAHLFNQALDRGGKLVATFDSCHSGSVTMTASPAQSPSQTPTGPNVRIRYAQPSSVPSPGLPVIHRLPHQRGAIVLTATQADQAAQEDQIANLRRGVFTAALVRTLLTSPRSTSVGSLVQSVNGLVQQWTPRSPQIAGVLALPENISRPLFGSEAERGVQVAVVAKLPQQRLRLDGGEALGLGAGAELVRVNPPSLKLRIPLFSTVTVPPSPSIDLTSSEAVVSEGEASSVQVGDLFRVVRFGIPTQGRLQLWLGSPGPDEAELEAAARTLATVIEQQGLGLVQGPRPESEPPTHLLRHHHGGWEVLELASQALHSLARPLHAQDLATALPLAARLQLDWPLSATSHQSLRQKLEGSGVSVLTKDADRPQADYVLRGTFDQGPLYRFEQEPADKQPALPSHSTWHPAADLFRTAFLLRRYHRWLTLSSASDAEHGFPYRMELARLERPHQALAPGGITHNGDSYFLRLVRSGSNQPFSQRRYVYLCALSSTGHIGLLYPPTGGNQKNRLPVGPILDPIIDLTEQSQFTTSGQPSVDTFVLLTTVKPLPNPSQLCSDQIDPGQLSGSESTAPADPYLYPLLQGLDLPPEAASPAQPEPWSIQRLQTRHIP